MVIYLILHYGWVECALTTSLIIEGKIYYSRYRLTSLDQPENGTTGKLLVCTCMAKCFKNFHSKLNFVQAFKFSFCLALKTHKQIFG